MLYTVIAKSESLPTPLATTPKYFISVIAGELPVADKSGVLPHAGPMNPMQLEVTAEEYAASSIRGTINLGITPA